MHDPPENERQGDESLDYELLDFGGGRKLERFGAYLLDRPAVGQTEQAVERPELWTRAAARFELDDATRTGPGGGQRGGQRGRWLPQGALPKRWSVSCERLRLELKPTDFGHLGFFPEQIENWRWIARQIRQSAPTLIHERMVDVQQPHPPLKILNLFAHTGGSTLATAAAGAEVVHVDSARGTVAWARRNAELSGLAEAPIRWIVEDAGRFVRRELARGNGYDAVILDPPSYGHGAAGEVWKLERDLPDLLAACGKLTAGRLRFVLLTCHSPAATSPVVTRWLSEAIGLRATVGELTLATATGRRLPSGVAAQVISGYTPNKNKA
jgi:23S rRNA (cytosine1962-C5)-methyltransferase